MQVQKFLGGLDYPATKQDIVKKAEQEGADENVRSTLEQIDDRSYESPAAVSQATSKARKDRNLPTSKARTDERRARLSVGAYRSLCKASAIAI